MTIQSIQEYERIVPNATVDGMMFYMPNSQCEWRIKTMYTKEPDTVEWIKSMPKDAVFYDIGANIGIYTMMAWRQGLRVFAFEPESQNFATLIRTLALNKIGKDRVVAYPFCITEAFEIDTLRLSQLVAGGSCHSFASDLDYHKEQKQWGFEQGTVGMALDRLVLGHGFPQPDYIKIDVDGFEDKVLSGAALVLERVKSILVEMDSRNTDHMGWKNELEQRGFRTSESQIAAARRTEGPFAGIGNVIFTRPSETATDASGTEELCSRVGTLDSSPASGGEGIAAEEVHRGYSEG